MAENTETVVLSNGLRLPDFCLGSAIVHRYKPWGKYSRWKMLRYHMNNLRKNRVQLNRDLEMPKVIKSAMEHGCHMFDTSRAYWDSEYVLGKALKNYRRDEYTIVTKLSNYHQLRDDVRGSLETSLRELGLSYVDVYLMHWPVSGKYIESWKVMEKLYQEGLCRAIGVCNCHIHHLEELKKHAAVMPMLNQFECHPLFTQNELRAYCQEQRIQVMAYTSVARMDSRMNITALTPIAQKYNKTIAQVILRWHQQLGNIPIVSSANSRHLIENTKIRDFSLTKEEMDAILAVNINSRLRFDPDNCDFTQL